MNVPSVCLVVLCGMELPEPASLRLTAAIVSGAAAALGMAYAEDPRAGLRAAAEFGSGLYDEIGMAANEMEAL